MVIVSERDIIFTGKSYQDILTSFKVKLSFSTDHHPQSDGETKRVNRCLEQHLISMVFPTSKGLDELVIYGRVVVQYYLSYIFESLSI